jgi:hypothetical protein
MIITANQVYGVSGRCTDGFQAKLDDLLFDDRSWNITFVVIRYGGWLNRQRVLVTPADIAGAEWSAGRLHLDLSRDQLQTAPCLESHPPVALRRSYELQAVAWDAYWSGVLDRDPDADPHLRNTRAVTGHHVLGVDAEAGCVDNFVIDDGQWLIRYLVVRIGRGRNAKRVVLEPRWVDSVVWEQRAVHIHLPKAEIEHGREFIGCEADGGEAIWP